MTRPLRWMVHVDVTGSLRYATPKRISQTTTISTGMPVTARWRMRKASLVSRSVPSSAWSPPEMSLLTWLGLGLWFGVRVRARARARVRVRARARARVRVSG